MACVTDAEASGLIRAAHDLGMDILVEVHDEAELARALPLETRLVGVNNRDLRTFKVSLDVCEQLAAKIPPDRIVVGESGILAHQDCLRLQAHGISAILVGESSHAPKKRCGGGAGASSRRIASAHLQTPARMIFVCSLPRP